MTLPLGSVQGYYKKSFDKRTYTAFEGIPYAKPPIGDLRFRVSCIIIKIDWITH